jgi:hypothetical protein
MRVLGESAQHTEDAQKNSGFHSSSLQLGTRKSFDLKAIPAVSVSYVSGHSSPLEVSVVSVVPGESQPDVAGS